MANNISVAQPDTILSYFSPDKQRVIQTYSQPTKDALIKTIWREASIKLHPHPEDHVNSEHQGAPFTMENALKDAVANVVLNEDCNVSPTLPDNPALAGITSMLIGKSDWFSTSRKGPCLSAISNILLKKNPLIAKEIQIWLQERFNNAALEVPNLEMRKIYIRNLLAFLPFFTPIEGSIWNLPVADDASNISYRVERIELTPRFLGSPLVAYGLVPVRSGGELIVLLKGTTFPADEGCFFSVLADLNPFASIGGFAFHFSAKNRLEKWIQKKRADLELPDLKTMAIGASLGGSLALQTGAYLTQYISSVHAFCSPAVTTSVADAWTKRKAKLAVLHRPSVNIYLNNGDPISSIVGRRWHPDWNTKHLFTPMNSSFQAHSSAFSAKREMFLMPISAAADSRKLGRRLWPIMQNFVVIPLFLIGVALFPLFCITHNIIRLAKHCFASKPRLPDNVNV